MRSLDDDPGLNDLLPPPRQKLLIELLGALSTRTYQLSTTPVPHAAVVEFNLEPLCWVWCADGHSSKEAARLLEFVLHYVGKYRLAANLHHDVTEASYAELTRQNEALKESEARYKELSAQLQVKVDEQVQVIDKARRELYESARLRSVGQLAAGVAHEINNPISFIASNMRTAEEYLDEVAPLLGTSGKEILLEDFRQLISESALGAQRVAAIVRDLKTFSNIDQSEFVACDLGALLESACHLVKTECPENVTVTWRVGDLPAIMGYPAKISQAFYNILDNAVRASTKGGTVEVCSEVSEAGIVVSVSDQGAGMSAETQAQAFDPFFTTRGVGEGTGLGLTVARDIARAHGGDVSLESHAGQGTVVQLRFART